MVVHAFRLGLNASLAKSSVEARLDLVAVVVFQSGVDAVVYDAVVLAWVSSFLVERLIIRSGGERSTEIRSDRGSGLLILLSIFFSISGFCLSPGSTSAW